MLPSSSNRSQSCYAIAGGLTTPVTAMTYPIIQPPPSSSTQPILATALTTGHNEQHQFSIPSPVLSTPATSSTSSACNHKECDRCFSMQESMALMKTLISKSELELRADFNARLANLEIKINASSNSSHIQTQLYTVPPVSLHANTRTPVLSTSQIPNTLPYRIVWGTQRRCTAIVIRKAICPLLPTNMWDSVTVKGSHRQRGSRQVWWHTIIAPAAIIAEIDRVWCISEARTSWSLQKSLSSQRNLHQPPASTTSASHHQETRPPSTFSQFHSAPLPSFISTSSTQPSISSEPNQHSTMLSTALPPPSSLPLSSSIPDGHPAHPSLHSSQGAVLSNLPLVTPTPHIPSTLPPTSSIICTSQVTSASHSPSTACTAPFLDRHPHSPPLLAPTPSSAPPPLHQ